MKKFSLGVITGLLIGLLAFTTFAVAGDNIKLIINGKEIACDVAPQVINGRTMVPARFVAEGLGASVVWNAEQNAVVITGQNMSINSMQQQNISAIEREKEEVLAGILKISDPLLKVADFVAGKNDDIETTERNLQELKTMAYEFKVSGTLDEYKEIKRLYLDLIDKTGAAAYCRMSILEDYNVIENKIKLNGYIDISNKIIRELQAEKNSLEKKGLM